MSQTTALHSEIDRAPAHLRGLLRHFADLRDGTHGDGAVTRADKERLFVSAVGRLDPHARQALAEMNDVLLLGTGTITATGVTTSPLGGVAATWTLGWPEQEQAGIDPISLQAFYGHGFHHPHLRGGTLGATGPSTSSATPTPRPSSPRCGRSPPPTCTTSSSSATLASSRLPPAFPAAAERADKMPFP